MVQKAGCMIYCDGKGWTSMMSRALPITKMCQADYNQSTCLSLVTSVQTCHWAEVPKTYDTNWVGYHLYICTPKKYPTRAFSDGRLVLLWFSDFLEVSAMWVKVRIILGSSDLHPWSQKVNLLNKHRLTAIVSSGNIPSEQWKTLVVWGT